MLEASVIIPTHNRAELVGEAIESVLAQRGACCELIVIDDGSTDDTWPRLVRLAERSGRVSLRIERTEHRGVAAARNRGIALAAAPLIAFLDSDDLWAPDKLNCQLAYMRENPRCRIAQTDEYWLRDGVRVNPGRRHLKSAGDLFAASLRTCLVTPSTVIIRRGLFDEIGVFDEDFTAAEDYDLWLRILARHEVGLIDRRLATRRAGHPGQLSATVPALDRFRILALLKLIASADLSVSRRRPVCEVLAEKCDIYASGLARRGDAGSAEMITRFARSAGAGWPESSGSAGAAVSWMRNHVRQRKARAGER